ncbi:hypothetical protein DU000_00415 [Parvibium lacunae]|uniref:DUF2189 domain-containing protein n=1 Tax=Parvibium lacunae TaxID=1888893 RepID=A0A368L6R4_9BURK|nr:hypothetical protein DU000_00415 [Parvibium lacunae]
MLAALAAIQFYHNPDQEALPMQAEQVTSLQASQWFGRGWQIFKVQPFIVASLTLFYIIVLAVTSLIPGVGALLGFILTPTLTFGFMEMSRLLSLPPEQRPLRILPTILFSALLADSQRRRRFLLLGVWYVLGVTLALLLSTLADGGTLAQAFLLGKPLTEAQVQSGELIGPLLIVMISYLPLLLAFWYAPALVGWAHLLPSKAIFFSIVACWRNKWPFTVYGLVALGWLILIQVAAGVVLSFLGEQIGVFFAAPFTITLLSVWLCSYYPSYVDVFGVPDGASATRVPTHL